MITSITYSSNILTHIHFALNYYFIILILLPPSIHLAQSIYNHTLSKFTTNHYILILHAILLWNLVHRLHTLSGDIHPNPGPNSIPPYNTNQSNFTIVHLNIRSLLAPHKLNDLIDFVTVMHDFDIVTLSETYLDNTIPNEKINIPGYDVYRNDRNRHGGGVCTYIKTSIPHKVVTDLNNPLHESIWLEVFFGTHKHLVGCFYRPPGQLVAEVDLFLDAFQTTLDLAYRKHYTSINILGDFNDRCVNWNSPHQQSELKN